MILFVDDERRYVDDYVEELRLSGFTVEYRKTVDAAHKFLLENLAQIDLLVLDIMMPPGELLQEAQTNHGLRTGERFYELARQLAPGLPVIILTNVIDEQVKERFEQEPSCWFIGKEDCFPFELVEEVIRILVNDDKLKSKPPRRLDSSEQRKNSQDYLN